MGAGESESARVGPLGIPSSSNYSVPWTHYSAPQNSARKMLLVCNKSQHGRGGGGGPKHRRGKGWGRGRARVPGLGRWAFQAVLIITSPRPTELSTTELSAENATRLQQVTTWEGRGGGGR